MSAFQDACGQSGPLELEITESGQRSCTRKLLSCPYAVVGGHARADVRLHDREVSRRHAYLQVIAGRVFCIDLGSRTGVRWDATRRPSGWLEHDRPVGVGPYLIGLRTREEDESLNAGEDVPNPLARHGAGVDPLPAVELEILNTSKGVLRKKIDQTLCMIGRARACRPRLAHPNVSSYHCSLVRTPTGAWVIDLLGTEGVRVNGSSVRWARLRDGDVLSVGPFLIRAHCDDPSSSFSSRTSLELTETLGTSLMPDTRPWIGWPSHSLRPELQRLTRAAQPPLPQLEGPVGTSPGWEIEAPPPLPDHPSPEERLVLEMVYMMHREQMDLLREVRELVQRRTATAETSRLEGPAASTAAAPCAAPAPTNGHARHGSASSASAPSASREETIALPGKYLLGPSAMDAPEHGPSEVPEEMAEAGDVPRPTSPPLPLKGFTGNEPGADLLGLVSVRIAQMHESRMSRWQKMLSAISAR